jgi:hypothetical protein
MMNNNLTKRATIYFDPSIHMALKCQAVTTGQAISYIVDDAIRLELAEVQDDVDTLTQRSGESVVSFESVLAKLKADGKI